MSLIFRNGIRTPPPALWPVILPSGFISAGTKRFAINLFIDEVGCPLSRQNPLARKTMLACV